MKNKSLILLTAMTSMTLSAAPIRGLAGLTGITFYEATSGNTAFSFLPNSAAMTTRIVNIGATQDFIGAPTEFYDVFYSDSNGAVNIDGEFITIEGVYSASGSGFNIAEVELLFGANPSVFASSVASFVPGGSNFIAGNVNNIIDGNLNTSTAMGREDESRMRVTVGFNVQESSPVPEPSSMALLGLGIAAAIGLRARRAA